MSIQSAKVLIGTNFTEDITDWVDSPQIVIKSNGDNYLLNKFDPDEFHFVLLNYDNYWNNRTLTRIPIKVLAGWDNNLTEIFRGYFRLGQKNIKNKTIDVTAQSYFSVFNKPIVNKEILENKTADEILKRACDECGVTSYQLTKSNVIIPVLDLKEYSNWIDIIKNLCESTLSLFHYENEKFVFRPLYSSNEVSQITFDIDNLEDLTQYKAVETIKNNILISSEFKSIAPKDKLSENYPSIIEEKSELYVIQSGFENRIQVKNYPVFKDAELVDGVYKYKTDTTVFIVDPDSPNFGQKLEVSDIDADNGYIYLTNGQQVGLMLSVSYKYLPLQLNSQQTRTYVIDLNEQGKNIQLLCAAWRNTSEFETGERVPFSTIEALDTVHLTDTIEQKDNKIRFTLKNNTSTTVTLSTLMVVGNPIKAFTPIKAKFRNSTSITTWDYESEPLEISNNFIVGEDQAKQIGNFLYTNLANPIEKIALPTIDFYPTLKLGKCKVVESTSGINHDFLITNITHDLSTFTTRCEAVKYPEMTDILEVDWLTKDNQGNYIESSLFNDTPLPTPSNFTVQYNNNTDGSKNIALSWSDIDNLESPRDGYEIFIQVKTATGTYTVDLQNDMHFSVSSEARGVVLKNLPLKDGELTNYYGFAIRPFRNVHVELTSDKSGLLRGQINYFNTNLTALDGFTVYGGTTIEDAISGNKESSSLDLANKILHSVDKGVDYAYSLGINDFKGLTVKANTGNGVIDRVVVGQFAPHKFGQQIRNGDGNVVLQADEQGLKLLDTDFIVTRSDNKSRTIINPTDGIKIQRNENGIWLDGIYGDSNGHLTVDGNLTRGTGNNVFKATFNGIQLGHDTFSSAPFRVDMTGALTSTKGNIGGWDITSTGLKIGTGLSTRGIGSGSISFYAGSDTPSSAPFRVETNGKLTATNATISGNITMTGGTIEWASVGKPTYTASEIGALSSSDTRLTKITATGIYTGTIDATQITAGSISADRISGGTLTGVVVNVSTDINVGNRILVGNQSSTSVTKELRFNSWGGLFSGGMDITMSAPYSYIQGSNIVSITGSTSTLTINGSGFGFNSNNIFGISRTTTYKLQVDENAWVYGLLGVSGNFTVHGSKNAVVVTNNYGNRLLYCYEGAEAKFMDDGTAELINGECRIDIDPIWLETVDIYSDDDYIIDILTPIGMSISLGVKEKKATYFIITANNSDINIKFDWGIRATRKGYKGVRLFQETRLSI